MAVASERYPLVLRPPQVQKAQALLGELVASKGIIPDELSDESIRCDIAEFRAKMMIAKGRDATPEEGAAFLQGDAAAPYVPPS